MSNNDQVFSIRNQGTPYPICNVGNQVGFSEVIFPIPRTSPEFLEQNN